MVIRRRTNDADAYGHADDDADAYAVCDADLLCFYYFFMFLVWQYIVSVIKQFWPRYFAQIII